jgi:hypothetical protein
VIAATTAVAIAASGDRHRRHPIADGEPSAAKLHAHQPSTSALKHSATAGCDQSRSLTT